MRALSLVVFVVLLPLRALSAPESPPPADPPFEVLVEEALRAYEAGDFARAIERFEAAYARKPNPTLIFNIARSHEKALEPERAIEGYERYLRLQGTTAALRARALDALGGLRREQVARARMEGSATRRAGPDLSLRRRPPDRTLEWSLIGGGAVLGGLGAVFGVLAWDANAELDRARTARRPTEDQQLLADETTRNAFLADVLVGTGIASAVTGVVLFVLRSDRRSGHDTGAPDLTVGPLAPDGGSGLVVSGRF